MGLIAWNGFYLLLYKYLELSLLILYFEVFFN